METTQISRLRQRPEWQALAAHAATIKATTLKQLFAADPTRGTSFAIDAEGIYFDYSKNLATTETIDVLIALAEAVGLNARIEAMFKGEKINATEGRAVLHTALRAPAGSVIEIDGGERRARDPERAGPHVGLHR